MLLDVSKVAGMTLRPRTPDDTAFLASVYASTRADELATTNWDAGQIAAFLSFQFNAQDHHYTTHYPTCAFYVIEHEGAPCGRLYVDLWSTEARIVEITLLPQYRKLGLGSQLLQAIIAQATRHGVPVSIHVERENPALRLYERLGFEKIEEKGVHFLMRRALSV
jgi:ribosomal protein S18 acetylase RimI-like enzyme